LFQAVALHILLTKPTVARAS